MAFLNVDCFSEVLHMSISMNVILPQRLEVPNPVNGGHFEPPYPVLYLLHGYNGDHTVWERRTSVERYASDKGIVVVMPSAHLSFYTDMKTGFRYWTFISEELPKICQDLFPQISADPEKTFAAGLSMGGYGAFKLGLALPEKFRAVASLSGAVDVAALMERLQGQNGSGSDGFAYLYGEEPVAGSPNDLFTLAERATEEGKKLPDFYQWCGRQDFLYQDNVRFRDHLNTLQAKLTYEEADGDHDWKYWDTGIERVLLWIQKILAENVERGANI